MKIAVINNLYAPYCRGGAEKVLKKIVSGLEAKGHEVFVIATKPLRAEEGAGAKKNIFFLPSRFFNLDKYPLFERFFYHIFDCFNFIQAGRVKKILLKEKPDLVITNNLKGLGFLIPGVIKKLKIKHIHILHDIQLLHPSGLMFWGREKLIESFQAKIYQAINRALFGSPAAIVSPSKWLLDLHARKGFFKNSKKKVLANYFPADKNIKNSIFQIQNSKFKFLYVGQLEKHKGVKFLIETFLEFLKNNHDAELIIVGSGAQWEELKEMIDKCEQIKILGKKDSQEVADLMRQADCLIVPSFCYENSPTVIYEAIAAGLPVVASKIGGIPELTEAAGGLAFTPGNSAELLEKMRLIFTHPEESDKIIKKEAAYQAPNYIEEILSL